jgi:cytochrome P450
MVTLKAITSIQKFPSHLNTDPRIFSSIHLHKVSLGKSGPRICPGANLAWQELMVVTAML